MQAPEFAELAGRVEGVARALLITIAHLERQQAIDGPALCAAFRRSLAAAPTRLAIAGRTLAELAHALEDARCTRTATP